MEKNILKIGRFEPSSKTCSCCGNINKELTLQGREWTCGSCNTLLDRDVNASINIKNFSLKNRNELLTLVGVMTYEALRLSARGSSLTEKAWKS